MSEGRRIGYIVHRHDLEILSGKRGPQKHPTDTAEAVNPNPGRHC
jgi:hypothetical protein